MEDWQEQEYEHPHPAAAHVTTPSKNLIPEHLMTFRTNKKEKKEILKMSKIKQFRWTKQETKVNTDNKQ